jgi:dynein heavy chain
VTDSLILYKEFFGRFDKSKLLTPTEIIEREKDCRQPIEDVFLHVKLVDEDGHVVFSDELFEIIKKDLSRIIDDIVKTT